MTYDSNSEIQIIIYDSNSEIQIIAYDSNSEIQIITYGCNYEIQILAYGCIAVIQIMKYDRLSVIVWCYLLIEIPDFLSNERDNDYCLMPSQQLFQRYNGDNKLCFGDMMIGKLCAEQDCSFYCQFIETIVRGRQIPVIYIILTLNHQSLLSLPNAAYVPEYTTFCYSRFFQARLYITEARFDSPDHHLLKHCLYIIFMDFFFLKYD